MYSMSKSTDLFQILPIVPNYSLEQNTFNSPGPESNRGPPIALSCPAPLVSVARTHSMICLSLPLMNLTLTGAQASSFVRCTLLCVCLLLPGDWSWVMHFRQAHQRSSVPSPSSSHHPGSPVVVIRPSVTDVAYWSPGTMVSTRFLHSGVILFPPFKEEVACCKIC